MIRSVVGWGSVVVALGVSACSSTPPAPEGPDVPTPPCVEVHFDSTVIAPDCLQFVGKVHMTNSMRAPLQVERVDYAAELHDKPLRTDSYAELQPIPGRGWQTVTLPIRVSRAELGDQLEDVLAEEAVRVTLRGTVYPIGFDPIPFCSTKVVPIPHIPIVSFDGASGRLMDGQFTVRLCVHNTNTFPLTFESVESFLSLNGKRYDLLRSECFDQIAPGATGRIALTMNQTRGKSLSVLVNIAKHAAVNFVVGGTIECRTPHGLFRVPLDVSSPDALALGL
jgi:LEA14-like dessication related protein